MTAISDAVTRFFAKRGHLCINYIDDFLIVADMKQECQIAYDCLIDLVQKLGLDVAWKKIEGPTSVITFLGVEIDCLRRTLSLP